MKTVANKILFFVLLLAGPVEAAPQHPFDLYDHEMHFAFFEAAKVPCEMCHTTPESYTDRTKIYPLGCHNCHNSSKPLMEGATQECKACHLSGIPKPSSHRAGWIEKHQTYAKMNPSSCNQCHTNKMFCIDCHGRRDSVQQRMHNRNFRFFHSIEARANPHKCDACHTVTYCQECHSGRGGVIR